MLILTRRPNEAVMIGSDIAVVVLGVSGQHVRLGFKAPKHVPVHRQEIFEAIQREQQAGLGAPPRNELIAPQLGRRPHP